MIEHGCVFRSRLCLGRRRASCSLLMDSTPLSEYDDPDGPEAVVHAPGTALLFIAVPKPKAAKNRSPSVSDLGARPGKGRVSMGCPRVHASARQCARVRRVSLSSVGWLHVQHLVHMRREVPLSDAQTELLRVEAR